MHDLLVRYIRVSKNLPTDRLHPLDELPAIELGRKSSHPFNLAFAQSWATLGYQMRRERGRVLESSAEAIAISSDQGFPAYLGLARMLHGWALTAPGSPTGGLDELRDGLRQSATTGTRTEAPRAMGILAEAYQTLGRFDAALATLETGLALSKQAGSPYWDAELFRLRGEVALHLDPQAAGETEVWFGRAIALARKQQARSLELRAALSAARFYERARRRDEAVAVLAPVYESFPGGHGAPDLDEARTLLRAWRS